jgi:hypothetical protein
MRIRGARCLVVLTAVCFAATAAVMVACGFTVSGIADQVVGPDGSLSTNDAPTTNSEDTGSPPTADGSVAEDAPRGPPPIATSLLSSTNELWRFDPGAKTYTKIGAFDSNTCENGIEEIAVDSQGVVFATRENNRTLYELAVDAGTIKCARKGPDTDYPFAMTFAPRGTLDPTKPVLVGIRANGDYIRIDRDTGAVSVVKAGAIKPYEPRGDMTFGADGKGYVSAIATNGTVTCTRDCLLEIDLKTGDLLRKVGEMATTGAAYALAFSQGRVYAFIGDKVDIITLAPSVVIETFGPTANIPGFRGGGSSTRAIE